MGCAPQCGGTIPLLQNPTPNETALWRYLVTSLRCNIALDDPCHPLPRLLDPTQCESAVLNYFKTLRRCGFNSCSALAPLPVLDCSLNLKNIIINTNYTVGPGVGGSSTPPTAPIVFVPPPCPIDDFSLRTPTDSVGNPSFPWDEDETVPSVFRIVAALPANRLECNSAHRIINRAGFMTFGGIGGGPINWAPDQTISFSGAPISTLVTYTTVGGTPTNTRVFFGIGLRLGGTLTNFNGYIAGSSLGNAAKFGSDGFHLVRMQNVNIKTNLNIQSGVLHLTSLPSKPIGMSITGQVITVTHATGTVVFTDTFGIIAGNEGPGFINCADFGLTGFGTGGIGTFRTSPRVCLSSP